jgi:hypothetical protein
VPVFNSWRLARAWNSVAFAQSDDKSRPALYRTTLIEQFDEGVRLVATDSFILLKAWVPFVDYEDASEPRQDELPETATVCMDRDQRVTELMKYVQLKTKADGSDTPITMTMLLGTMKAGAQGSLDGMTQQTVSFHLDHEYDTRIETPIFDGNFPEWKPLWYSHAAKPTSIVSFGADGFLRLGKLSQLWDKASIRFVMGGQVGVAKFHIIAPDVSVEGLAMPVRDGREDTIVVEAVPPSEEGIHAEFGDALDIFLADVLKTEVKQEGKDDVVDSAKRSQLIRAGTFCMTQGSGDPSALAGALDINYERAVELCADLVTIGVLVPSGADSEGDALFAQARALVVAAQLGAVSMLQRKLKIGHGRAQKLMDALEAAGVVGPVDADAVAANRVRPVLMSVGELAALGEAKYTIGAGASDALAALSDDGGDDEPPEDGGEPEPEPV